MSALLRKCWPILALATVLAVLLVLTLRPYQWNVTALFHMDNVIQSESRLPSDFVILSVPSYDGAQYYQVARNIPKIVDLHQWNELLSRAPGSYAYQRFLLPLFAFVLALGSTSLLPFTFLAINLLALLLTCRLILRWDHGKPLYALALCLSPAAMVALHFSLAEPLTILLTTAVLVRYVRSNRFTWLDLVLLSLATLTREVNILFIAYFMGFSVLRRRWKDVLLLCIPAAVFLAWHGIIFAIFHEIPFFISTGAREFPGHAALMVLLGNRGYDRYTLSAVALFLGLVLPAFLWTGRELVVRKELDVLSLGALAFLCIMLVMPGYIWGSITSIGRVITPMYPLLLLYCSKRDTVFARALAVMTLLLGVGAGVGLALSVHPFVLAP